MQQKPRDTLTLGVDSLALRSDLSLGHVRTVHQKMSWVQSFHGPKCPVHMSQAPARCQLAGKNKHYLSLDNPQP